MATYFGNAFSLGMLGISQHSFNLRVTALDLEGVKKLLREKRETWGEVVSVLGHADTTAVLNEVLGTSFEVNRVGLQLEAGDVLVVAQYNGPRLPEGAKSLPEGAAFRFFTVSL
jgi:hypothetical protein